MDRVIDTASIKEKLQAGNISVGPVNEFCRILALRLSTQVSALGFLMAFQLLISDMETAPGREIMVHGEPIHTSIAGLPIGSICNLALSGIVQKVCPEDFAQEVLNEWKVVTGQAAAADGS